MLGPIIISYMTSCKECLPGWIGGLRSQMWMMEGVPMGDYHGIVGQVFRDVRVSNIGITRGLRHGIEQGSLERTYSARVV